MTQNEHTSETNHDANATTATSAASEGAAAAAPAESATHAGHADHAEPAGHAEPSNASDASAASAATGEAAAPANGEAGAGAPTKKRRRRRRKSAAERAAARAAAGQTGDAPAEGEDGDDAEEGDAAEGAEGASEGGEGAEGKPAANAKGDRRPQQQGKGKGPQGQRGPNDKRGKHGKHDGEKKEPRERPAFSHGDVVFGKVTEITDEAIFVDLAGKGRGIFDRRELDIPDEPAQGPDAPSVEDDDDLPPPKPADAAAEGSEAAEAASTDEAKAEEPAATPEAAGETDASKPREKRIVVARTIAQGEGQSEGGEETKDGDAAAATTDEAAPAEAAAEATEGEAAATEAGEATEKTAAPAPTAPAAAPVLPPVVLEIGSVFVGVVHNDGARGGLVVLTRHPRRASKAKPRASTAFREKTTIEGLVTGVIKGGIEVDVDGLRAFAPRSHVDLRPGADLHHLVGKRMTFDVTQYAKKGRDVVLSRKATLENEAQGKRAEALAKLPVGEVVEGTVKTVVTFGAFLDVGGVEGLVPLSEMSHNRADTPRDVFKVGEKVQVKILRVDEKGKVWLSRRAAVADPWGEVAQKYAQGSRHTGKVVRVQPFGAFIELESGIDGLIHTADLSIKRIEHPTDVVKVGDSIEVVVSHLDTANHKIALHPAPAAGSPDETPQRVQVHKQVKVAVVSQETGGLTVRVLGATGRNARGFIPAGATGTPRGTDLKKAFPTGKELDAKVLEIDPKRGEVKLSIKALTDDNERSSYQAYRAQVKKESKFGTFGDLLAKSLKKDE